MYIVFNYLMSLCNTLMVSFCTSVMILCFNTLKNYGVLCPQLVLEAKFEAMSWCEQLNIALN